jgi:large conductance mechanosensitive channel
VVWTARQCTRAAPAAQEVRPGLSVPDITGEQPYAPSLSVAAQRRRTLSFDRDGPIDCEASLRRRRRRSEDRKGGSMFKGFREFIMRGNVVDLAVAVVIGAAFGAMVAAFVANIITPLIAAIFGQPDFSGLEFTINNSTFRYGLFINAVISFLLVALAIYYIVVLPMNRIREAREKGQDPAVKECPECLSEIPVKARKCAHCGSDQHDAAVSAPTA